MIFKICNLSSNATCKIILSLEVDCSIFMAIQKLPKDVRSTIRSGLALASTTQCITELVLNSLDAGANSIIIRLDIPHFKLEVDDNGRGITIDDLQYVGNRYYTSKCRTLLDLHNNLNSYGYRGEALASLSESCRTLTISTRPKNLDSGQTFQKSFNCGNPLKSVWNSNGRKSHGTTVTVKDFLYNAPVRQKRIIANIDMEEIRVQVEGLALSHPHVSFTIVNESEKTIVRQIPSFSCRLETFSHLYGQEISKDLCPIGPLSLRKLNIDGYISKSSYHSKRLQFIFVNGRLVKGTKLHKLINMIMRKSDVLRSNGPWQELPMPERVRDFLWVSPLKKKDRFCVFMVNISCPVTEYDITLDPKKTMIEFSDWDTLLECMENVVKNFLKEHKLACVALDPGISSSQSSDDSPMSVMNEMEQLEREDALGQKLSQFKCPLEKSIGSSKEIPGESETLKIGRAICGLPAKRNLKFPSKLSDTVKNPLDAGKPKEGNVIDNKIQCSNGKCDISTEVDPKTAGTQIGLSDYTSLITYPLLPESDVEIHTPVQHLEQSQKSSYQFGVEPSIEDSSVGSLAKFRKNFRKSQTLSHNTPDDIQKISVDEPPPIIRRPAPLEHRVKGCCNRQLLINSGIISETFSKLPGKTDVHTKRPMSLGHDNSLSIDDTLLSNARGNNDVGPKKVSSHNLFTSSGNVTCGLASTSTQTENGSFFVNELARIPDMAEFGMKPNLKNLNLRMKIFKSNLVSKEKLEVFKFDDNRIEKPGGKSRAVESLANACKPLIPVAIRNGESSDLCLLSKQCESSETIKKFLTSEDLIRSLEKEKNTQSEDRIGCITYENHEVSTQKCPVISISQENSPIGLDPIPDLMPVLQPYFSSPDFDEVPPSCGLDDTPPQLLEFKNEILGAELSKISEVSLPTRLNVNKRKSLDVLTEECSSSKHFKDVAVSGQSSLKEKSKALHCRTPHRTKPDNHICDKSPPVPFILNREVNASENSDLTILNDAVSYSDVDFDSTLGLVLNDSPLKCTRNNSAKESSPVEPEVCSEIEMDSNLAINPETSCLDDIEVQLEQCDVDVDSVAGGLNKEQCLPHSIPNSKDSSSLISSDKPSQDLTCYIHSPGSEERKAAGDEVTPTMHQGIHDQKITSPFFNDSVDWDTALSEMYNDLECQKATDIQKCLQSSILGQQNIKQLKIEGNVYHKEERFEMFARHPFLPKGLSPVVPVGMQEDKGKNGFCQPLSSQAENDLQAVIKESSMLSDELSWIKWGGEKEKRPLRDILCRTTSELDKKGKCILPSILSGTEDDKLHLECEVLSARLENQSKSFIKVFNLIYPCTFSKDILMNFKMLGKLDCKFIVAKIGLESESVSTPIVMFDQHAVHERIRLEQLMQDYQVKEEGIGNGDAGFIRFKSSPLVSTLKISLNFTEARMMESFREHFERLGLVFDINLGDGIGSDGAVADINEIPACLSSKDLKEAGPLGLKEQVHSLIREQVENLIITRGIGTYSPTILREAINSKACRGAVKFGDSLTDRECRWLLKKLSACDTPFQCAHGRPSMYPIVDLKHLGKFSHETEQNTKPPRLCRLTEMMNNVKARQYSILNRKS